MSKKAFVNLANARYKDQRAVMENLLQKGICPFCPEHVTSARLLPVVKKGRFWRVHHNRWPYENTRVHLLIIHRLHVEKLSEVSAEAVKELLPLLEWAEKKYRIRGGAFGLRFGDIRYNGATVAHLHGHLVATKVTNRDDPDYKPVRFRMG